MNAGTASVYGGTVSYAVDAGTASVAGTANAVTQTVSAAIVADAVASAGGAYTGPFAVSSAGSHYDSGIDVAISGGKVVFNGSAFTAPSVASHTLYLSSGQRLYVYISSGGTPSYTTSEPDYPLSNEWYTMIAENKAGKLVQTQVGDIYITVGGGASGDTASVGQVMQVPSGVGGTDNLVDVKSLRGALTAGQAVDVTSEPDNFTGDNWRGYFTWDQASLGFASFPKYAPGLTYLLIADFAILSDFGNDISGTVTPAGTWLDGSRTTRTILGTDTGYTRIAMLFSASNACKLNFTYTGSGAHWDVRNLREYEVTPLTAEAIAYIAGLANPDAFADYYLVKSDMVQPWTYIINMGASPATTVASGLAYEINATSGSHIITVDTIPAGYVGRDTYIRLLVGETGNVVVQPPLKLITPLTANAVNNCLVQYRDGVATMSVTDIIGGYVVTVNGGTADGSLYYGLTDNVNQYDYITFGQQTDSSTIDFAGATVTKGVNVTGNGTNKTILTGTVNIGSQVQFANLAFQNVNLTGGTMTLPSGVTVKPGASLTASAGAKVVLVGGAINGTVNGALALSSGAINGTVSAGAAGYTVATNANISGGGTVNMSGATKMTLGSGYNVSFGGVAFVSGGTANVDIGVAMVQSGGTATFTGCTFSGNVGRYGASLYAIKLGAVINLTDCIFEGNTASYGEAVYIVSSATVNVTGGTFGSGQRINLSHNTAIVNLQGGTISLRGQIARTTAAISGTVNISSDTVIDLTDNDVGVPIVPGGQINVATGGCTVINSAGTTVSIAAGNYTQIKNDGTSV